MKRGFRFLIISFVLFTSFSNFVIPEKAHASLTQTDLDRWTKYGNDTFADPYFKNYKSFYLYTAGNTYNKYKNNPSVSPILAFGYLLNGSPDKDWFGNSSIPGVYGYVLQETKASIDWMSTMGLSVGNLATIGGIGYIAGVNAVGTVAVPATAVATGVHVVLSMGENIVNGGPQLSQNLTQEQLTAKQVYERLGQMLQYEVLYSQQKNGIISTADYLTKTTSIQNTTQQKIDALQKVKENPSIGLGSISGNPNTISSATNYVLLEPSVQGLPGNLLAGSNGKVAIGNSISDVTSFIFVLLVTASLIASVFMIMAGAFTRMTTDSVYKKTEGSEKIRNAVYGLLAVLTMYLIILFINPDMLRKGLNPDSYKITNIKTPSTGNAVTATPQVDAITGADYNISDAANRKLLSDAGIGINKNNCTQTQLNAGGMQSCTSLDGLPRQTIDMLISLKTDCEKKYSSCPLVVTGGTEPGHASHGKGLFPVDLRCSGKSSSGCDTSENLYKFLDKLGWTRTTKKCFFGRVYGPYQNFYFCNEINSDIHWHVYK